MQNKVIAALEQAVTKAIALHQAGKLDAAKTAYEAILRNHPRDPNVLMNLSTLQAKRGNYEESATLLKRLISFHPQLPQPHFGYGNTLMRLGRWEEALASFDRSCALQPGSADTYYNRGLVLDRLKRFEEALVSYDQTLQRAPNHVQAFSHRMMILNVLGRHAEVLATLSAPFHEEKDAQKWLCQGIALQEVGHLEEAFAAYAEAIAQASDSADSYTHRANAFNKSHRYEEAFADSERGMRLGDDSAFAHNIRAVALNALARYEEAITHYEKAIARDPSIDSAYWNNGLVKLMLGDYANGLPLYEWRWKVSPQKDRKPDLLMPLWLGEVPLTGKTILIHPEQGLGDYIQCARYVPLLVTRGAKVLLHTPAPLLALFTSNFSSVQVEVRDAAMPFPAADFHCPTMSLPLAFGVDAGNAAKYRSLSHGGSAKERSMAKHIGGKK